MKPRIREYPLDWPAGWKRHHSSYFRTRGKFQGCWLDARRSLEETIKFLNKSPHGALICSSNIPPGSFRKTHKPDYHDPEMSETMSDPGVAISFLRIKKGQEPKEIVLACDKWTRPRDNLKALAATVMGLYKIDYWGCSEAMERAFSGLELTALAPPRSCWAILGIPPDSGIVEIEDAFRKLAKESHPDKGGNEDAFKELTRARKQALEIA